jgi:hypothetical protein
MRPRLQTPAVAKLFLVPWALVSAWACMTWVFRVYEHGRFRYNPHILQFEMGWSRLLLLGFGGVGMMLYRRSHGTLPRWTRAFYLLLITVAASVLVLDLIISLWVTPAQAGSLVRDPLASFPPL